MDKEKAMALGDRLKNASGKRKDIHVTLLEQNLDVLDVACSANGKTRGEVLDMLIEEALAPLLTMGKKKGTRK